MSMYGYGTLRRLIKRCWVDVVFSVSASVPSSSQPKKQTHSSQWVLLGGDFPYSTKFFLRSRRIRVNLLSCESKTTDKRGQYDWRAEKNLDGYL